MENKKETSSNNNPMGVCEKLFNAFNVNNSAFRPLRRLTFKNHEPPNTTQNHSPPNKPQQVLENNYNNNPSHHHQQHHHHDTSSSPPKTSTHDQSPPKKPLDVVQVQVPSKIENIQNKEAQQKAKEIIIGQKVPVNPPETVKARRTTTIKKEEAPPPPPPPPPPSVENKVSLPTPVAPKVAVAPQVQVPLPVPVPPQRMETMNIDGKADDFINRVRNAPAPVPATVGGRRQPQRMETNNIDGKADDFINRVRNKLRSGSNVGKATSN